MISLSKMLDRPIARDGRKFDVSLLWMVVLMTVFSLVMIYSASIVYAASEGDSQFSFVSKQQSLSCLLWPYACRFSC